MSVGTNGVLVITERHRTFFSGVITVQLFLVSLASI